MKIIVFLAIIGLGSAQLARPRQGASTDYKDIQILRQESENNGDGTYSFSYETSDGTSASQKGYLKPPPAGSEDAIQVQEGNFQYVSPEGEQFRLDYLADENGFQPQAAHLPTAPPIPPEIANMLAIVYKNAGDQINRAASAPQAQQQQRPRPRPRF